MLSTKLPASCGCAFLEHRVGKPFVWKHNLCSHPLYKTWVSMRRRCANPDDRAYKNYGGRGITVCDEWKDDFAVFLRDMGERPSGGTLERKDVNGPYSKENCCWVTHAQQQKNKRNNILATINGETMILADWCRRLGLVYGTVVGRIHKEEITPEQALQRPVKPRKLSRDVAREIRAAQGAQAEIAARYGIDASTVSLIKSNKIYADA